jgi:hypothetical protein
MWQRKRKITWYCAQLIILIVLVCECKMTQRAVCRIPASRGFFFRWRFSNKWQEKYCRKLLRRLNWNWVQCSSGWTYRRHKNHNFLSTSQQNYILINKEVNKKTWTRFSGEIIRQPASISLQEKNDYNFWSAYAVLKECCTQQRNCGDHETVTRSFSEDAKLSSHRSASAASSLIHILDVKKEEASISGHLVSNAELQSLE